MRRKISLWAAAAIRRLLPLLLMEDAEDVAGFANALRARRRAAGELCGCRVCVFQAAIDEIEKRDWPGKKPAIATAPYVPGLKPILNLGAFFPQGE